MTYVTCLRAMTCAVKAHVDTKQQQGVSLPAYAQNLTRLRMKVFVLQIHFPPPVGCCSDHTAAAHVACTAQPQFEPSHAACPKSEQLGSCRKAGGPTL